MSEETFSFKVGAFECIIVKDGSHAYPYPAQNVFINFFVCKIHKDFWPVACMCEFIG